ncbi:MULTISPECIES: nucleotidyltransferase family protein [unclassified Ochrobactrum]|uniref:nucleotidyltransferase family protein n=1 Tax=unclassified Ochrobactrum TaxID=239106 RepID=UPI000DEF8B05|nr:MULTISPECIES: nucleotidyltransferase family protein [unclassified Ochrobactrum]MBQ0710761.1 nucleotidyltransferase family protein [Ochrobactrum sp. AP1BH01-1]
MKVLSNHLRHAGLSPSQQRNIFSQMVLESPMLTDALHRLQELGGKASEFWLVSGALYNTIWNRLTGRPNLHGIKDLDIIYFDGSDLSWEAEDAVIARGAEIFRDFPLPVEIRNQARVHLWFEKRFGKPYPPLLSATESIERYSTIAHCVGVRLAKDGETAEGGLLIHAPFGLDDIFSFRIRPNRAIDNRETHEIKAARALQFWPELIVQGWDVPD